jgi:hypothetical protein
MSGMDFFAVFRRRLLRMHGTLLTLVALGSAAATTYGWIAGEGPFGFMHGNPMVWVMAIQAYLLMAIIAVLLILGSNKADARKWNIVGAPIGFHAVFLCLEAYAALRSA